MTLPVTTAIQERTVSKNTSSTRKYTSFGDTAVIVRMLGNPTQYQELIDGENITIVADFTSMPGGGIDLDELIDDL